MDKDKIYAKVVEMMKTVTLNEELIVLKNTKFMEVKNWDSLNTVDLELDVETSFDIGFDTGEFQKIESVEDLIDVIQSKIEND